MYGEYCFGEKERVKMKKTIKKMLSLMLCLVLVSGIMAIITGCNGDLMDPPWTSETTEDTEIKTEKSFTFVVTDADGNETTFNITSDKQYVGEALFDEGLIEGEEGPYGLYVKYVNGMYADYEETGTYWAFYIDGEYAVSGVDQTDIEDGREYSFKVEK